MDNIGKDVDKKASKKEIQIAMEMARLASLAEKLNKALRDKSETYEMRVKCFNCGMGESIVPTNQYVLKIPIGFSLADYSYVKGCPLCGCNSLKRVSIYG